MAKPSCRVCGVVTKYGSLFCCPAHEKVWADKHTEHIEDLKAAGFEATDTPNIFIKDGVSVTLERTVSLGLDKTVLQHGQIATQRNTEAQPAVAEASR